MSLQLVNELLSLLKFCLEEIRELCCGLHGRLLLSSPTENLGDIGRTTTVPGEDLL